MMKYQKAQKILNDIHVLAEKIGREVHLMEVCGTHTQAISRFGIRDILPKNVKLTTGPGCPVCVTAQEDIDAIVNIARAGVPVASYGDALRVPGYFGSLDQARSQGAKVFSVYSTEEALELQKEYPDLVFFGIGFETTTPMTAYAIQKGLTVFSTHKLFIPAMQALLDIGELRIDGFISPGHVAAVVGTVPFEKLGVSQVITGFEQEDILIGIYLLLKQIHEKRAEVENEYIRAVQKEGNTVVQKGISDVFEVSDGIWRGFGTIPNSGLKIREKYSTYDARVKYKDILDKVDFSFSRKPVACKCGEIIRGLKLPQQCPMFGRYCTFENPQGPCMVSVEGACNVAYRHTPRDND